MVAMGKKILAIHDGHNASVGVFDGANVLSAISEERLNRDKFFWGYPALAVDRALADADVSIEDIECVTVSHLSSAAYAKRKFSHISSYNPRYFAGHVYNVIESFWREKRIHALKGKEFFFCDHHRAHAASAYYMCGWEDALVLTIDALGDQLSHTAYFVQNDSWQLLAEGGAGASLGAFFAAVTEGLGFKANRHEGKVVGLAAMGIPEEAAPYLKDLVVCTEDGRSFRRKPYAEMKQAVVRALSSGVSRESVAACAQHMLEELVLAHVRVLLKETKARRIACAGGVFANVKLNQRILEESGIEDLFIQPAMGDEGLVLGAPLTYLSSIGERPPIRALEHLYLGNAASEEEILESAKAAGMKTGVLKTPAEDTAQMLAQGEIIGWFDGRMEFGPRALGCRSIIADPRTRDINGILNKRLQRSDFMPFAPSVLENRAEEVFDVRGARLSAEFMTITMNVRPLWAHKVPAIVHTDSTARPQLVRRSSNRAYFDVIEAFSRLSGVPLVLNTSFNIHEEPIVSTPADALRALQSNAVDCVVFNNRFVVRRL